MLAQAQAAPSLEASIEAEQTAAKAHAAANLTVTAGIVPGVAVMGGSSYQEVLSDTVRPESFAYVSVLPMFTLLRWARSASMPSKRPRRTEAGAADLGVQLTRAKAAAAVPSV